MAQKILGWPEYPVPGGVKKVIYDFYRLVDTESEQAYRQWSELFSTDGEVIIAARNNLRIQGREGIEPRRKLPKLSLNYCPSSDS